eukprot:2974567-Lingulodinium_polyedra.AAC.1
MCKSAGLKRSCSAAPCLFLPGSARGRKTTRAGAEPSLAIRVPAGDRGLIALSGRGHIQCRW